MHLNIRISIGMHKIFLMNILRKSNNQSTLSNNKLTLSDCNNKRQFISIPRMLCLQRFAELWLQLAVVELWSCTCSLTDAMPWNFRFIWTNGPKTEYIMRNRILTYTVPTIFWILFVHLSLLFYLSDYQENYRPALFVWD